MADTIYVREPAKQASKGNKGWRYRAVLEGRGRKIGDLKPPFFARYRKRDDKHRSWIRLTADTFKAAKQEVSLLEAAFDASAKGLAVAEAHKVGNANRTTIEQAVEDYLEKKSNRSRKTILQYTRALTEFLSAVSNKVRFLDDIEIEIGRAHVRTPVTRPSRMPSSA